MNLRVISAVRRLSLAVCTITISFRLAAADVATNWVATWGSAPQLTEPHNLPPAPGLSGNTLRQVVRVSIGGTNLRLRFSNAFGNAPVTLAAARIALSAGSGRIHPETDRPLTFNGAASATIPAGELLFSDPIAFELAPLADLAVTIHFGATASDVTGHPGSRTTSYLKPGAAIREADFSSAIKTIHWYILSGVEVLAGNSAGVIAVLGDSITDGRGSTTDGNDRWPDNLARRLQANSASTNIGVLNQGIGGNCVLRDCLGPAMLTRLERDVLAQEGVRWLIVFGGINDIGGTRGADAARVATNLITAYETIMVRARAKNIRVYGGTLTAMEGSSYFSPEREAARQTVNDWIRHSNRFDAVIDFDAATRDPDRPARLAPVADSGDHLHPGAKGYQMMAAAIDLNLFAARPSAILPAAADRSASTAALPPPVTLTTQQDHRRMMNLLGMTSIRRGRDGNNTNSPNYANYDESRANLFPNLPDPLVLKNGRKVTTPGMWWQLRRPEIVEDFDREIYGRMPANTPKVNWEVTSTTRETNGEVPVITKQLVGRVDNSSCPNISVNIQLTLSTPAEAAAPVPVIMQFGFGGFGRFRGTNAPGGTNRFAGGGGPTWQQQALAKGWGYAVLVPNSIQADNGAGLTQGIIGLCNQGQPRLVDDWGALRAWAWGASRALDYFETDSTVDAKRVGLEGHSRYGKATLVAMAYEPRLAVAYVSSSGHGGAKLHRRDWGEIVENVAGSGEYHWMAGNYIKYAGPLNWGDLPVDSHQLIALCAPRPVFLSAGVTQGDGWVDAKGTFMAGAAAGPVYTLLGRKAMICTEFPPTETLCDGDVAFRQHAGGHTDGPNWPTFLNFAGRYFSFGAGR